LIRVRWSETLYPAHVSKALELPPEVTRAFVRDMRAFFAPGGTGIKADSIATMRLHALKQH
jgi:hypothetical protein